MAHNPTVRTPITLWTNGSTILASELQQLDLQLSQCVNGVGGSCHAPLNQITITGQGLQVTGPTVVGYTGKLTGQSTGGILLADNDFPEYGPGHVGSTRTRMYPMSEGLPLNDALYLAYFNQQIGTTTPPPYPPSPIYQPFLPWAQPAVWRRRFSDCGVQALAPSIDFSDGLGPRPMRWRAPFKGYDGATLTQVVVRWHVQVPHQQLPSTMPKMRVVRIDSAAGIAAPLTSVAAGADADGYVTVPTPSSAAAWNNQGQTQSFAIPCDQNNVVAVSAYIYAVDVIEEQGLTGYPWQITVKQPAMVATFAASSGTSQSALDGTSTIDNFLVGNFNERVLVGSGARNPGARNSLSPYSAGSLSSPSSAVDFVWRCTTAGITASTAPTFPTQTSSPPGTIRSTVQDGTVVWTAIAPWSAGGPTNFAPDYAGNGIWVAATGEWQRSLDLTLSSDFSQGMIVPVATGGSLAGTIVQASTSIVEWTPGQTPLNFVLWGPDDNETPFTAGKAIFAHGLVWHSLVATYTGITAATFE